MDKITEKYLEANKNTYIGKHFDALPDEEKEKFISELEKKPSKYTEAQKRASLKYQQDKAQIKITVSKEQREKYQKLASDRGVTLTELIVSLLDNTK